MKSRSKIGLVSVGAVCALVGGTAYPPTAHAQSNQTQSASTASAVTPNGLAATPPMGFNDWNAFKCNVSASLIEQTALAMHTNGMQQAGYEYVNIDDCWAAPTRTADGELQADPVKFPNGIKSVADYVHGLGLKLGIYEDAGTKTCAGYPGSLGHEAQDAATFASWDVDYLKYDQCNIPFGNYPGMTHEQVDQQLYTTMSNALRATGRPIVFSMCTGTDVTSYPWLWGGAISNLWRTTPDIQDSYPSMLSNVASNAQLAQYAGPGHWNDPDMLEIGNGGMTTTEYESEMSLWSIMSAPLISGTSITNASPTTLSILENKGVIAVDQDSLGVQGRLISSVDGHDVFVKPLADGDVAVALFNSTGTAGTVSTNADAAGIPRAGQYNLKDLWSGKSSESAGEISAFVPAHGTTMYLVSTRGSTGATAPSTTLDVSSSHTTITSQGTAQLTVTLTNNSARAIVASAPQLDLPTGWTAVPEDSVTGALLAPGASTRVRYQVTAAAATAPIASVGLVAQDSYRSGSAQYQASSTLNVTLVGPIQSPLQTANTSTDPAVFGQLGQDYAIVAGGAGIRPLTTTTRGTTPAADQYAAIYAPQAAGSAATAVTTVTAQAALRNSQAGLVMRNDMTGAPAGVALYLTGFNTVAMAWNSTGGTVVDTASTASAKQTLPVTLKLVRSGTDYTGYFSTDGGRTWTEVADATVAASAAAATQDVGIYHASGTVGAPTEADFTGFDLNS